MKSEGGIRNSESGDGAQTSTSAFRPATSTFRGLRSFTFFLALAFFLSGASALTYEIVWQRQMYLVFGASAPATTAILTAIFLGIAFGSQLAVPLLRRAPNPLTLYAGLEAVMGAWGLLVPTLLRQADSLYVAAVARCGEGHTLQDPLRFVLAVVPLLPATLAMGATIPVMVRCVAGLRTSAVAWAYGINILGAVAGSLLTGLAWLQLFGILQTRLMAVALNVAAVAVVVCLRRRFTESPAVAEDGGAVSDSATPRGLALLYLLSGFVALGLEVVWLRFLGIVNSNSTATFTLTLTVYLFGMGLGSLLLYPRLKRCLSARTIFSVANAGTAICSLLTFGVLYRAASINFHRITLPSRAGTLQLSDIYVTEGLIIATLMFLPTLFMGLVYPAVCDCFEGSGTARDRWVGRTYFLGTLGSVIGILLVGIVLIPTLGLHGTFSLLVGLSVVVCLLSERGVVRVGSRRWLLPVAGGVSIVWGVLLAAESRPVLREALVENRDGRWFEVPPDGSGSDMPTSRLAELIHVKAGASGTVMVKLERNHVDRLVYVDDQLVASTNLGARVDALMLAHLPLLLHPQPSNALTVGFGTGGTSYAMTTHGVETYCVEIEPEVPRAAAYSAQQNFGVLDNPLFTLILNDARDHLHAGTRTYDVIATDVTNLQYKQNGNLYTVEYFDLMRRRLKPGGVACAWIPMAAISTDELRILMRGFIDVFPHATLWYMNHTHTNFGILIGTPDELQIDFRRLQHGFASRQIADNLKLVGMTEPLQFVHCLHLDENGYRQFCDDAPRHTDDRPILEFSSPMTFYQYQETFEQNLAATLQLRPTDFRRFVTDVPGNLDAEFARHQTASHSFCNVMLLLYRFQLARQHGDRSKALAALRLAIEEARAGMAAWPDDSVREEFYVRFFSDAQRWAQATE
ncbi:hypothetical protein GC176_14580 [bacterium]|nr:hypothetical protein [bacterium]